MSSFTKDAIKMTFVSLLDQKPLNQITVKMVVEECGINRDSFYYHFQDIPALLEEIIMDHLEQFVRKYPTIDSAEAALNAAADFTMENRRVLLHIYHSTMRHLPQSHRYTTKEWQGARKPCITYAYAG